MDQREYLNELKRAYAYDQWAGRRTIDANLHVRGLSITGRELPGWEAGRIQSVQPAPSSAEADHIADPAPPFLQSSWSRSSPHAAGAQRVMNMAVPRAGPEEVVDASDPPSFTRSMWRPQDGPSGVVMNVNVFEASSREAAETLALLVVGGFESPLIRPHDDDPIGDVTLRGHGEALLLFIRGNVVCLLRNAGPRVTSVRQAAKQLDEDISSKPDPAPTSGLRLAVRPPRELKVGDSAPLAVEVVSSPPPPEPFLRSADEVPLPVGPPVTEKFFPRSGELYRQQGRLMYRAEARGRHDIEVFALAVGGDAVRDEVVLTVT
jgi:hypothetical protein